MTRPSRGRLFAIAGRLVVAAAVVAAVVSAQRHYDEIGDVIDGANLLLLAAALASAAASIGLLALAWRTSLSSVGTRQPLADVARWFAVGQIGKYVPGGVWHFVGQGELARRAGVPARIAYASVALNNVGIVAGGAALVVVGDLGGAVDGTPWWVAAVGAAALGALSLPPVRRRARRVLKLGDESSLGLRSLLLLAAAALPAWMAIGTTTWLVARSFGTSLPIGTVAVAAIASWLAGILTLPAPGGLGVREAAFVGLTAPLIGASAASVVAVSARLVFVVADVLCWTAGRLWLSAAARRAPSSSAAG